MSRWMNFLTNDKKLKSWKYFFTPDIFLDSMMKTAYMFFLDKYSDTERLLDVLCNV